MSNGDPSKSHKGGSGRGGGLYKNMGQSLPLSVCYHYFHNPIANIGSFHLKSKLKKAKI